MQAELAEYKIPVSFSWRPYRSERQNGLLLYYGTSLFPSACESQQLTTQRSPGKSAVWLPRTPLLFWFVCVGILSSREGVELVGNRIIFKGFIINIRLNRPGGLALTPLATKSLLSSL